MGNSDLLDLTRRTIEDDLDMLKISTIKEYLGKIEKYKSDVEFYKDCIKHLQDKLDNLDKLFDESWVYNNMQEVTKRRNNG